METDAELVHLSNGHFEVRVSPATGRIRSYGPVGGTNALWWNDRALDTPSQFKGWINWGGDKAWIWPENDWKSWTGVHAPPADPPQEPYQIEHGAMSIRMVSPRMNGYGTRIVRDISLERAGSRVTIVSRLEQCAAGTRAYPTGVWMITQVPAAPYVLARMIHPASQPGFQSFPDGPWMGSIAQRPRGERHWAVLHRDGRAWAKVGLESDLLAVPGGEFLFTARTRAQHDSSDIHAPYCRAQVYSEPDTSSFRTPGVPPYVEMEFTSPVLPMVVGESVALTVEWELHRCPGMDLGDPEQMLNVLNGPRTPFLQEPVGMERP